MKKDKRQSTQGELIAGIPLSEGTAHGRVWHGQSQALTAGLRRQRIPSSQVEEELARVRHAVQLVSLVVENSVRQVSESMGPSFAQMFVVLREMLHDVMVLNAVLERIRTRHLPAPVAVSDALGEFRARLSEAPSPYLKERARDIVELEQSLLEALINPTALFAEDEANHSHVSRRIAVVDTLTPRLVLNCRKLHVSGVIGEHGGATSHAAILCRAVGLPAVSGIRDSLTRLPEGSYVTLNGTTGQIGIAKQAHDLPRLSPTRTHGRTSLRGVPDASSLHLLANINLSQSAIRALAAGAEGIGLYRTEFEFAVSGHVLTQQEQFIRYRNVVITMMGLPVYIRLMDVTEDKAGDVFNRYGGHVEAPFSGATFLLSWPELLETQARAIAAAAAYGPVRVIYPMVADADQFVELRRLFQAAISRGPSAPVLHGAMIEQPSACYDAERILEEADFANLGTNDLTRYILNVDRNVAISSAGRLSNSRELWEAIGHVAEVASRLNKELVVCGEMASDLRLTRRFTQLGIRTFSMDTKKIRHLRRAMPKRSRRSGHRRKTGGIHRAEMYEEEPQHTGQGKTR